MGVSIEELIENIPKGKHNAIHQKDLADKLHIKSELAKKYVQEARRQGYKICSGQAGYWIAESDEELKAFVSMLRKQALTRLKTTKATRDYLKEYKGQISLTDASYNEVEEVQEYERED